MKSFFNILFLLSFLISLFLLPSQVKAKSIEITKSPELALEIPDNTFEDLVRNLIPGESRSAHLEVTNKTDKAATLLLRAESKVSKEQNLLQKTEICLEIDNKEMVKTPLSSFLDSEALKLGVINPSETVALDVYVKVDSDANNAYILDKNMIFWNFMAFETLEDLQQNESYKSLPKTGVSLMGFIVFGVSIFGLMMLVNRKKGRSNAR